MTILRMTPDEAVNLVKEFEGFSPTPYNCPANIPTIGYGHVITKKDKAKGRFRRGSITKREGETLLRQDLSFAERAVCEVIEVPLTDGQYGALVSFTFNLGRRSLQTSTLRRKLNEGDYFEAANQLLRWVYAGGKKLEGLKRRRRAEKALFENEAINTWQQPQKETPMMPLPPMRHQRPGLALYKRVA